MRSLIAGVLVLSVVIFAFSLPADAAGKRVALVIGNGNYKHAPALANPSNDARLVSASLRQVGFSVVEAVDADRDELLQSISKFGEQANGAEIALFFYAGHGLEVGGRNWMLPVDADIGTSSELPVAAVRIDDVLDVMELSGARVRLAVLDACRNNPLPRSLSRAASRGLARMDASAAGTMIAFSAAPGTVALDGAGANSPFSTALAQHLTEPDLELRQMMARVRADVMAATNDRQVPWVNEAVVGDYYLAGKSTSKPADGTNGGSGAGGNSNQGGGQQSGQIAIELAFWDSVKDSDDRGLLDLYLKKYPDGAFRELAKAKIAILERPAPPKQPETGSSRSADQGQLEATARRFVVKFQSLSSLPVDEAVASMSDIYSANVDFYGKRFSLAQIVNDKRNLFIRWPTRDYRAPENEMLVHCDAGTGHCNVSARVYWSVHSSARGKSASGVSQTDFELDMNGASPHIVYENSQTLSRN